MTHNSKAPDFEMRSKISNTHIGWCLCNTGTITYQTKTSEFDYMGRAVTSATIEVGAWAVRTFSAYWVWEQRSDGRPFSPYTLYFQFLGNTNTFLKSIFFFSNYRTWLLEEEKDRQNCFYDSPNIINPI